jgi:hypothetical protein
MRVSGDFKKLRGTILDGIVGLEAPPSPLLCTSCNSTNFPLYRCRSCQTTGLYCSSCTVKWHSRHPLHQLEEWTGTFFRKARLADLGLRVQLGHRGSACPAPQKSRRKFCVIHSNGFHSLDVDFCGCPSAPLPFIQIIHFRWFPTSFQFPQTGITFEALNLFHLLTLQGKLTAYDFYYSMVYLTDNYGLSNRPKVM